MRHLLPGLAVFALVALTATAAVGGPTVKVYFDEGLTQRTTDCLGPGLDTLYIVAEDFDAFLTGIEFKLTLPPSMIWIADIGLPPVYLGTTVTGISMGFAIPQNGYQPLVVAKALILWNCVDCSAINQRVEIDEHPLFNSIRATRWPDYLLIDADGAGATVCPFVALDIRPGSCPNPLNKMLFAPPGSAKPQKGGVLPVAIVGSPTFDVSQVDLSSLTLEGVAPAMRGGGANIADVATDIGDNSDCGCTEDAGDGIMDIALKFDAQAVADAIGAMGPEYRTLTLTGTLLDGTPFEASDCVKIVGKPDGMPSPSNQVVTLDPVFPNPFNPVARIAYELPTSQHVRLSVYDVSGRLVEVLVNEVVDSGRHVYEWDANNLASGVYFSVLEANGKRHVQRMTLLK